MPGPGEGFRWYNGCPRRGAARDRDGWGDGAGRSRGTRPAVVWPVGKAGRGVVTMRVDKETGRPYSSRYIGSLVADFHRNLLYGGIFLYPDDVKNPNGKLRLLYEAAPLSLIAAHAGGLGSTGRQRILDIEPAELH